MADAVVVPLVACSPEWSLPVSANRVDEHKGLLSLHFGFAFVLFLPRVRTIVIHVSCVCCHIGLLLLRLRRKASLL